MVVPAQSSCRFRHNGSSEQFSYFLIKIKKKRSSFTPTKMVMNSGLPPLSLLQQTDYEKHSVSCRRVGKSIFGLILKLFIKTAHAGNREREFPTVFGWFAPYESKSNKQSKWQKTSSFPRRDPLICVKLRKMSDGELHPAERDFPPCSSISKHTVLYIYILILEHFRGKTWASVNRIKRVPSNYS